MWDKFEDFTKLTLSGAFVFTVPLNIAASYIGIAGWYNSTLSLVYTLVAGIMLAIALKDEEPVGTNQ